MVDSRLENFREKYVKFLIGQTYFLDGCGFAFSALLIPELSDNGSLSPSKTSAWIATSSILLRPFVVGLDTYLTDTIGRRGTLCLKLMLITIGWVIVSLSSNMLLCFIGRLVTSLGLGFSASGTNYIIETCSKNNINSLVSISILFTTAGVVGCNLLQYFFSWKVSSTIIAMLSCSVLLQTYYVIPETKHWYMRKNRRREAILSDVWFQKDKNIQETQEELNQIERTIHSIPGVTFSKIFYNAKITKPLIIYSVIVVNRMGTGYLIIIHYTFSIFKSLTNRYNAVNLTLFTVVFNFAFTILFPTLIKRYKPKTIFSISSIAMMVCLIFTIVYKFIDQKGTASFPWIPVTCLFVYTTMNIAFFDPAVSITLSEIFPKSVNSFKSWLHRLIEYKLAIIYVLNFPSVNSTFGIEAVLWFFLLSTATCFFVVMYMLPKICNPMQYERTNLFEDEVSSAAIDQQEFLQSMIDVDSSS